MYSLGLIVLLLLLQVVVLLLESSCFLRLLDGSRIRLKCTVRELALPDPFI